MQSPNVGSQKATNQAGEWQFLVATVIHTEKQGQFIVPQNQWTNHKYDDYKWCLDFENTSTF